MDNNMNEFELPQLYRHHVFSCHTQRPPDHPHGSCGTAGGGPLWERLGKAIEARGLTDVGLTAAGCLGFCASGPLMVVYPDGVWYRPRSPEDIDEIVDSHLKNGRRVDRLVIVLTRS
ncbi:(2Fe-2S) ferredoxin domain-containing protein [Bradyrhizobium manausense]|uniref:Ferredoxin n=2 Tax=Bradyrhizobium TaxID=374 RepID=A0A0R3ED05_9BRAD|nr:(2Fe-2S) ferredoxin domain-containing protein [Bradyrhizobium manausense]KRQ17397.1 ferredoxin [Bradyrhizobium manausense]